MQKITPAREARRNVRSARRRRITEAAFEALEQRQMLTTYLVDKTVDLDDGNYAVGELTLREAVNLANANAGIDTINFNVALANPQFLLFSGGLSVTESLNIDGTNLHATGGQATVNGQANSVVFDVALGATVNIQDITLRNGRAASGGGIVNAGNLTLSNVVLTANSATVAGGGVYNTGTLTLNSATVVSSNNASTTGGGIYNAGGAVIMSGATLQANTTNASGIGGNYYVDGGSLTTTSSTITTGAATDGAGIYATNSATLSLTSTTVSNNNAVRFGGGIFNTGTSSLTLNSSLVTGNSSGVAGSGGGIYSLSGTVNVNSSTISTNRTLGPNGGAIRNAGTLNINNSTLSGNISNSSGGGIYNTTANGLITVNSSTISGNQSVTSDGGGFENTGGSTLRIINSTVSGNTSANRGGGVHAFSGNVTITNSTFTANRADSDGNGSGIGGGVHMDVLSPTVTMNNTIVADNFVGISTTEDDVQRVAGTLNGNYNLIGTGGSGGLTHGVNGNQVGIVDPLLGALANNGGPTLTHALLLGSPAKQAGSNALAVDQLASPLANDQRGAGFSRIISGTVDVGAYEAPTLTFVVEKTVDLNDGNFGPGELTLREAVALSNLNAGTDTITFNVAQANPIFLLFSGALSVTESVNIDGTNLNGLGGQATVNAQANSQIFDIGSGANVVIADITLRQGRGSNGGGIVNAGNLTLNNVLLTANSATVAGGGVYNTGTLTLTNGTIVSANNASTTGGGIYNNGGAVIGNNTTLTGNTTNASGIGGGIYSTGGSVNLTSSTVTLSSATDGSGIYGTNSTTLTLTSSTISNNNAIRFGGGLYNTGSSTLTANNSLISGNSSGVAGSGGGIYSLSGTVTVSGSTITNNRTTGPNGGGIRNAGTLNVINSTISNNQSNAAGGGIYNTSIASKVTILNSTISGNQSVTSDGGGIENTGGGVLRVLNSTISGNSAANRGGGIHAFSGTLTITNATITNNRADSDNNATGIGGGLHMDVLNPNVQLDNSIIADNFVGSGSIEDDIQKPGGTLNGNSNLIGTGGSGGLTNGVNGNQVGVANPLIGPLANNGGPTMTHLPANNSPVIHAGDSNYSVDPDSLLPFASDQRGGPRYLGVNVDIGAVEVNLPLTLIVDNTVDLNNGNFGPGNLTLREAVDLANANPGLDTIFFNVGLANPQFLLFSGSMTLTDSVLIDGTNLNGAGGVANVHGNNNTQPFIINNGVTATFQDLTIRNGRASNGGAINNAGTLTLTNVLITANTATLNGGGIYNTGTVTINGGSSISTGNASTTGAGIYNTGTVIMNTATIQGNAVSALGIGGGIYNAGGTVNLTATTITTNTGSDGAGIYNTSSGTLSLTNSTVSNNSAIRFGGGIFNTSSSTVTLNNSLVTGNSSGASGSGGGIYSLSGTISISGSTISNNRTTGPNGGGIRNAGTLNITNSTVSGNISNSAGGGIYNTSTTAILTIIGSTISGNQSVTADGGGIESTGNATIRLINSTVSGNTAAVRGGGLHLFSGTGTITNSTITNNRADSDNNATGVGGGLHMDVLNPNVTLNNSIIADNFVGSGVVEDDIQKPGGTLTGSFNLIGTGGSGGLVNAVSGNQVGVANPRLGALANNGGPTLTHALLPGSTAIQGGSNALAVDHLAVALAGDQRGNARIFNSTVDVGAVEYTVQLNGNAATNEGSTYSLTVGPVIDNAATNTNYRINWGDGNITTLTALALAGLGNVVTHVYVDDNPTATPSDPYTITLDVQDAFTSPSYQVNAASKNITVNNVNPVAIISGIPVNGLSGSPVNMTASFTDAGVADTIDNWTWNVTKNGTNVGTQSGLSSSFSYTPTSPGHYIVSLVATDDDTGVSIAATKTLHVSGVQLQTDPTDGTKTALFVYGTGGNDTILLTKLGVSLVRVSLNSVVLGTYAPTGRVIVQGGEGDDTITDSTVIQHTILYGGLGNDTITSNGANDVLVGGAGNDNLVGGAGDDLLIGGDGADNMNGGADEDLLIGGSTSYDAATLANMASLATILNTWSTSGAGAVGALLLGNVTDDLFADSMTGGSQNDLFYADSVLDITDAVVGDTTVAI